MIEQQPCNQAAVAAFEMEVWTLVAELAKPLCAQQRAIPALIALRIVISHCIPADALRLFIADLNAALEQKPARPN